MLRWRKHVKLQLHHSGWGRSLHTRPCLGVALGIAIARIAVAGVARRVSSSSWGCPVDAVKVLPQTSPTHSENSLLHFHLEPPNQKKNSLRPSLPISIVAPRPIFARLLRQATCWSDPCVSCACDVLPRQPAGALEDDVSSEFCTRMATMAIATATTIIVVINPSSIPHQSYVHPPLLQKRVPPKPKDPFQSRCLEHLFANYLCWSKAESVPLSNAVMSFCPTMLAHTIHGLKKPIENCLAEVSFNQLHPCDTPEKWISSDTLHLFSMFEWWMFWAGSETPNLLQNFRIVSTSSWSPILLRKSVSLFHPKKRLLKKTKRWSCLKGASITVQMDQKSSKTQELLETRGNQHLLKALSWYTSANVMHVEYSYSCINLSKKTPDAGYLGISSVSNGRQSFVSQSTLSNNPQSSRQISSQNCHTWHSLIQKKGLFTSNPCKKTQHG